MRLSEELQQGLVFGDGAMGTELMSRGAPLEECLERLTLDQPDLVAGIHRDYIAAGARVIETNTFGANAVRLSRFGLETRVAEINQAAVTLAKQAANRADIHLAGSVGPTGLPADEAAERNIDRAAVYREQLTSLLDAGVDLIQFETFLDVEELALAFRIKQELAPDIEAICSLACSTEGRLSSGQNLGEAFDLLKQAGAGIVGVNCINGPSAMVGLLRRISVDLPLAAFPNAGYPRISQGRYVYPCAPEYFAAQARELADLGARLLGGCCGIGPEQIKAMVEALQSYQPNPRVQVRQPAQPSSQDDIVVQQDEESILDRIAAGKKVIVTELDPPKTLSLDKFFEGAKALSEAGSDCITLADNSLAILRVSNVAVGAMLKQLYGIMPLLHLSCRDRNLLGLQSTLMGLAAMGIRHVLPLTGDPAKVGDHPGAKSVYDVNSVKLMEIVAQMNQGLNYNGKDMKANTRFVIGCTFNPNVKNIDTQIKRLERKLAAGAQYVMTQPVFDRSLVKLVAERTKEFNVPIFMGVWPLLNGRQSEFLHNEVPGILIPDEIRERMRGLEKEEGAAAGIAIAKEIAEESMQHFPGVYLITPFLRYDTTEELAAFSRGLG